MNCTKCGAALQPGIRFCGKCGATVLQQPAAPFQQTASFTPPLQAARQPAGRVCPGCGEPLTVRRKFCLKCGANVMAVWDAPASQPVRQPMYQQSAQQPVYQQAAQQPVYQQPISQQAEPAGNVCPKCGQILHENIRFCPKCGVQAVKTAANTIRNVFEHTMTASSAPGEVRVSLKSVGGPQLNALLGNILRGGL